MSKKASYTRSPEVMSAANTALVVVDVQQKLIGLIPKHERIVWNIRRLLDGAKILGVTVLATEQYPQGLGHTVAELAQRLTDVAGKSTFSCCASDEFQGRLDALEAHVCVQQTVLDLVAAGYRVFVAADAIGSRFPIDYEIALKRMESAGATLTTTESALFEWCERSGTPEFKQMSALVKEASPS
jgi:nicotinamidase-related amidase